MDVPTDIMREISALTLELTKMRQKECGHLCIENYAPEVFAKLLRAWYDPHGYLEAIGRRT